MDMEIVKTLRNRSFVDGKQKTWISNLTDRQLWDVFIKLYHGESLTAIAEDIEKRKWIKSESSVKSISQGISKFKKRIDDILVFPVAIKDDDLGELEGLKMNRKVLVESIRSKGPGNAHLAKESKVLLEINNTIERLREKEQEKNNPENFFEMAYDKIKNLDEKSTEIYIEAILYAAERKLKKGFWLSVLDDPPDLILFNQARKRFCTLMQRFGYLLKNEREKLGIVKIKCGEIDEDGFAESDMAQILHRLLNQIFLSEYIDDLKRQIEK
jgi:hypothetical protein